MRKILLIAAATLLSGVCLAQGPFDRCGIIERGLDCYAINVFGGDRYQLSWDESLYEYVGDTVRVFGNFIPGISLCMFGGCCVYVDSIETVSFASSPVPANRPVGILILCLLLSVSGGILMYRRVRLGRCSAS